MKNNHFLCGVIEGYYGRPWSFDQRKHLFEYCLRFGLNSYVYAPKDDLKHRSKWRDLYSNDELAELAQLINYSKRCGLSFIYALSPGLDLTYSSEKDLLCLKRKFDQLSSLGCQSWAILFDDIESEMCQQDKNHFASFGHGQVSITNQIFEHLNKPTIFLFCPTEYCSQMAKPSEENSAYLETIGSNLDPNIQIFWTGPKIISRQITVKHLELINRIVKRRVTLWDNLNANDYDQRRLCLGPLAGRSSSISSHLAGLLINPNVEFEMNFIPLHTTGQWFQSLIFHSNDEQIDDSDETRIEPSASMSNVYHSEQALERAILDWLPEFNRVKSSNELNLACKVDNSPQEMSPKPHVCSLNVDEDSQDSINEQTSSQMSSSNKVHRMECDNNGFITLDDIRLLVDLFYLPFQYGIRAQQMLNNFHWLKYHRFQANKTNQWHCRLLDFENQRKSVQRLVHRLLAIPNRCLLYDLYNYISEMNSTLSLCSQYLRWIENPNPVNSNYLWARFDPGSRRGDIQGEFLSMIPFSSSQKMFDESFHSNPTKMYFIRPTTTNDQCSIYNLCRSSFDADLYKPLIEQHQDLLVDKSIGGYWLTLINQFDLCYSVEKSDDRLSFVVLTIVDSEHYDKYIQTQWIKQLEQKYSTVEQNMFDTVECPSWIYKQYPVRIKLLADLTDEFDELYSIGLKLIRIISETLAQRGYQGCHALIDEDQQIFSQLYLRLGFIEIPTVEQSVIFGKLF